MSTLSPVVVALDYDNEADALHFAQKISPELSRLKIGKELFTATGPALVEKLHNLGFEIFLDLKFHDIPNTVAKALVAAANLGVWMVNVHASGGARMLDAARAAIPTNTDSPLLIAVTLLTSMDEKDLLSIGCTRSAEEQALLLASLAQKAGFDGVVCSAQEAEQMKQSYGQEFKLITPGIRPAGSTAGDQKRIMTPAEAMSAGSDYLVIGRPITQAEQPQKALEEILWSINFLN